MTSAELEGDTLGQEESDTETDVLATLLCDVTSDEEVSAVALAEGNALGVPGTEVASGETVEETEGHNDSRDDDDTLWEAEPQIEAVADGDAHGVACAEVARGDAVSESDELDKALEDSVDDTDAQTLCDCEAEGDALPRELTVTSGLAEPLALPLTDALTENVAGADVAMGDSVSVAHTLGDATAEDAAPEALAVELSEAPCVDETVLSPVIIVTVPACEAVARPDATVGEVDIDADSEGGASNTTTDDAGDTVAESETDGDAENDRRPVATVRVTDGVTDNVRRPVATVRVTDGVTDNVRRPVATVRVTD